MEVGEAISAENKVLALVAGRPVIEAPADLFIPPDALEVLLESFSGPLDLLLYLIRRQDIDILDIPIVLVTQQYMHYIELMENSRLELAADYLVMAAMLAEIKSRMLLPPSSTSEEGEEEEDPRMALVRKLQVYEQFKEAASKLDALPRYERDHFQVQLLNEEQSKPLKVQPAVELSSLVNLMANLIKRETHYERHQITREPLCVRERMSLILQHLHPEITSEWTAFMKRQEGRVGLVVTLLAILELSRQSLVVVIQSTTYGPIHLKAIKHG